MPPGSDSRRSGQRAPQAGADDAYFSGSRGARGRRRSGVSVKSAATSESRRASKEEAKCPARRSS